MWYAIQTRRRRRGKQCLAPHGAAFRDFPLDVSQHCPRIGTRSECDGGAPQLSPVLEYDSIKKTDRAESYAAPARSLPVRDSFGAREDDIKITMAETQQQQQQKSNGDLGQIPHTDLAVMPDGNQTDATVPNPDGDRSKRSEKPPMKQTTTAENVAEAGAGVKLTGAQLKAKKQAEKAARRAEKVAQKGEEAMPAAPVSSLTVVQPEIAEKTRRPSQTLNAPSHQGPAGRRRGSNQPPEPGVVRIPIRPVGAQPMSSPKVPAQPTQPNKQIAFLSHLTTPANTKPATLAAASREVHPAVLTLALHLRSLTIAGSTARTLSLLLVLKRVIQSYTTPPNTALSRHLTSHISHQISFLASARPLGIAQGNAIRWLKKLISQLDPDLEESAAKKFLCASIDTFIHERVTLASEVIASRAADRIAPENEIILTYGKSSLVEETLMYAAKEQKKKFKVVVIDSRPHFEGQNLARGLLRAGMCEDGALDGCEVVYALTSGLADIFLQEKVSLCLLGASGMLGNGQMQSRCGTAMVASMAKQHGIPLVALSERVKFTVRTALDNFTINELGDPDWLVEKTEAKIFSAQPDPSSAKPAAGGNKRNKPDIKNSDDSAGQSTDSTSRSEFSSAGQILSEWKSQPNLYLLNLMYDYTPADMIDAVICELGTLPPGAVPVVNGLHGDEE